MSGTPFITEERSRRAPTLGESGYKRVARDAYFTPAWVTQALVDSVELTVAPWSRLETLIWEPAVGDGRMANVLRRAGYTVVGSDVHDYGWNGTFLLNFVREHSSPFGGPIHAIVTNPPFDLAREFIRRAIEITRLSCGKVAILQRHEFDAPRSNWPLFKPPFAQKLILPRRPKWSDEDKASPRFPYAWYVWDWQHGGAPTMRWLEESDTQEALDIDINGEPS